MRGKIIQYNGADGSGTLVANGKQYRFALTHWRGDSAPAINRTVEVVFDGDAVATLTAVGDDVLLKEKAVEFGGKLGALWNKVPASLPSAATDSTPDGSGAPASATMAGGPSAPAAGAAVAGSLLQNYGKPILIAYALFLLGTLAFNVAEISMMGAGIGKSLFDVAGLLGQIGTSGGGSIKLLLLLAYASIAAPLLWHDRRAWLALVIPLLAVLWAVYSVLHALDSLGNGIGEGMAEAFSLSFGFYLTLFAAIALAGLGVLRTLRAA